MPAPKGQHGDWECRNGKWVWVKDDAAGGNNRCGPKPPPPAGGAGNGHWTCKKKANGSWGWVWKPKTPSTPPPPPPPPNPPKQPKCGVAVFTVAAGRHASLKLSGQRVVNSRAFTVNARKEWCAGPKKTINPGSGPDSGGPVNVAEIREGPEKGRFLVVNAAGISWRAT